MNSTVLIANRALTITAAAAAAAAAGKRLPVGLYYQSEAVDLEETSPVKTTKTPYHQNSPLIGLHIDARVTFICE